VSDSPVFDRVCEELERRTSLDRLASRGTVRLALKSAGLDVASVDAAQMGVVLRKLLPAELAHRGIDGAAALCESLSETIAGVRVDTARDRAAQAAATIARLGS
jgi:hypothetical protein